MTHLKRHSPGQLMFCALCAACLALILYYSDCAIEYMSAGLRLCARTVIPSLFPFMVISGLTVSAGLGELLGRLCEGSVRRLFGVSGEAACALLLGAVCGFPIGAKTVMALLDVGHISRREAERLLCFCNSPSSAFLISAVGISLYSSRLAGVIFYFVTLSAAVAVGIAAKLIFGRVTSRDGAEGHLRRPPVPGLDSFTAAVSDAAVGMLTVCAYVVFFSAVMGCLGQLLRQLGCPDALCALLYGLVELSGGVSAASALELGATRVMMTAFIIGWSGLSVHFQIMSLCRGRGIGFRGYFVAKLCQGLLCAATVGIIFALCPAAFAPQTDSTAAAWVSVVGDPLRSAVLAAFGLALALALLRRIHRSTPRIIY